MIPPKPTSRHAVACVGALVDNVLAGCPRTPLRFVVSPARNDFGLGVIEEAELPAIKVCGVCSRHVDQLLIDLRESCPFDAEPAVFTVPELLENWEAFFADITNLFGAPQGYIEMRHHH